MSLDKKNVAIFFHCIAHYRRAVFEKLSLHTDYRFTIYSGSSSNDPTLKVVEVNDGIRWRQISNFWFMNRFLFQPKSISNALFGSDGTIIFLGDIHYISTWIAAILARLRGKTVLFWTHGTRSSKRNAREIIRLWFYRLANGLLLYGDRAYEYLSDAGYPPERMHVVYNSLDYETQKRVADSISSESRALNRESLFASADLPILLVVGRMIERVNYPLLLKAAKELIESGYPVNILIIGTGPEKEATERLAEDLSIRSYINFYGACYDEEELGGLINASDVMVAPGSIGLSCIHSLVYGTPVICHSMNTSKHKIGPEAEVIADGHNGMFFHDDSHGDLARAVRRWIDSHPDRKEVERVCKESIYPRYTPYQQAREIVSFINKINGR